MFQPTTLQMEAVAAVIRMVGAQQDNPYVSLGALREIMRYSRADFDTLIKAAAYAGIISLATEDNQKVITSGMRYNAIHLGGEERHYAIAN